MARAVVAKDQGKRPMNKLMGVRELQYGRKRLVCVDFVFPTVSVAYSTVQYRTVRDKQCLC